MKIQLYDQSKWKQYILEVVFYLPIVIYTIFDNLVYEMCTGKWKIVSKTSIYYFNLMWRHANGAGNVVRVHNARINRQKLQVQPTKPVNSSLPIM